MQVTQKLILSLITLLAVVGNARADAEWKGSWRGGYLWDNADNWSGRAVPSREPTRIDRRISDGPVIGIHMGLIESLHVGVRDEGMLVVNAHGWLDVETSVTLGTYSGSRGSLRIEDGFLGIGTNLTVGDRGKGSLLMTGGLLEVAGRLDIGKNAGSTGRLKLGNGVITVGRFGMRCEGGTATMDISGGALSIEGNCRRVIERYIASGWITAYGGDGIVEVRVGARIARIKDRGYKGLNAHWPDAELVTVVTARMEPAYCIEIDQFEAYADDDALRNVWVGTSNATVSLETAFVGNHYAGEKVMRFDFDTASSPGYCEVRRNFSRPQNWCANGAAALSLRFRGDTDNDVDEVHMYLTVSDGTRRVKKLFDYEYLWDTRASELHRTDEWWFLWQTNLAEFRSEGIDLEHVTEFCLGFSDMNGRPYSGSGTMYFDNIGLRTVNVEGGAYMPIFDPSLGEGSEWHVNDHCVVHDGERWHLFGICSPSRGRVRNFIPSFVHATSESLTHFPWDKEPWALIRSSDYGETRLWAPHVIEHNGLFYMYYCAGGPTDSTFNIYLATSTDMFNWTRHEANPMTTDGYHARDPYVLKDGDRWIMYYTATHKPTGGHRVIACVTSTDLIHWGNRKVVWVDTGVGAIGGRNESPQVVRRGDYYYLFIGPTYHYDSLPGTFRGLPQAGYVGTAVYRSKDPFNIGEEVGYVHQHAPEIIRDIDGQWYITHCGIERKGVYVAPLFWNDGYDDTAADSCSVTIPSAPTWIQLTHDDFETDVNNADTLYTQGSDVDTPGYTTIKVDFTFRSVDMHTGDSFSVRYYDGSVWHTVARYTCGVEFSFDRDFANDAVYHKTVYIRETDYLFPANMKIAFRCDTATGRLRVDEVRVSATTGK